MACHNAFKCHSVDRAWGFMRESIAFDVHWVGKRFGRENIDLFNFHQLKMRLVIQDYTPHALLVWKQHRSLSLFSVHVTRKKLFPLIYDVFIQQTTEIRRATKILTVPKLMAHFWYEYKHNLFLILLRDLLTTGASFLFFLFFFTFSCCLFLLFLFYIEGFSI